MQQELGGPLLELGSTDSLAEGTKLWLLLWPKRTKWWRIRTKIPEANASAFHLHEWFLVPRGSRPGKLDVSLKWNLGLSPFLLTGLDSSRERLYQEWPLPLEEEVPLGWVG